MNTVFGETAPSNRIWTRNGLQSNCRMCNQDVEKNCYYVREYLGDTSSYDAHLFFCFHDFRREFYMIWDHICLLILTCLNYETSFFLRKKVFRNVCNRKTTLLLSLSGCGGCWNLLSMVQWVRIDGGSMLLRCGWMLLRIAMFDPVLR